MVYTLYVDNVINVPCDKLMSGFVLSPPLSPFYFVFET